MLFEYHYFQYHFLSPLIFVQPLRSKPWTYKSKFFLSFSFSVAKLSFNFNLNFNLVESLDAFIYDFSNHFTPPTHPKK